MDAARKKRSVSKATPRKLPRTASERVNKVKQMFKEWLRDSSGYDEEAWPELKRALNENHSRSHKLLDD